MVSDRQCQRFIGPMPFRLAGSTRKPQIEFAWGDYSVENQGSRQCSDELGALRSGILHGAGKICCVPIGVLLL
jgi:hypothetical protein